MTTYDIIANIGRLFLLVSIYFSVTRITNSDDYFPEKKLKSIKRFQYSSLIVGIILVASAIILRAVFHLI